MAGKRGIDSVSSNTEDNSENVKRKLYNDIRFRMIFHQDSIGRVIGRNAENLRNARESISAKAHLKVPECPATSLNKDRILSVACELADVSSLMQKLALSMWHEGSPQREFNLLIPTDIVGSVVGKGGSTLAELRDQHGCAIRMYKDKLPFCDERILEIQGQDEQLESMVDTMVSVLTIIQEHPLLHDHIRYAPYGCTDQDYLDRDCGGYMKRHLDMFGSSTQTNMSVRSDGYPANNNSYGEGYMSASSMGTRNGSAPGMIGNNFMNEEMTKDIMIDDKLTSSIIGNKGARINMVRSNTPAKIHIDNDNAVINGQRRISVSGMMNDVMSAANAIKTLINEAENEARQRGEFDTRVMSYSSQQENYDITNNGLFEMAQKYVPFTPSNEQSNATITLDLKINSKNAGQVLGRKASIINEIKKISKCLIKIAKECDPGTEERSVTITGTPRDVHIADYLVTAVQHMPKDAPRQLGLV